MVKTLTKDVTKKDGTTFAKGEKVTVAFDVKESSSGDICASYFSCTTADGRRFISGRFETVGIKTPSLRTLEKYSDDGIAKSVFGARVEPDGWDANGAPSWLRALGMI